MGGLDSCFFFEGSGPNGYFGILGNEANSDICMSEDAIVAFIQDARPDLFQKLDGLPIKSSDIQGHHSPLATQPDDYLPSRKDTNKDPSNADRGANADGVTLTRSITLLKLFELQHKHKIQSKLLNNYNFSLRRVRDNSHVINCACPTCHDSNLSLEYGQYFLTLVAKSSITSVKTSSRCVSYSLLCLEHIFGNHYFPPSVQETIVELYHDGTGDMPKRKHDAITDEDGNSPKSKSKAVGKDPDFPFRYPSNSAMAWQLRQERQLEIEEIRKADKRFEHVQNEYSDEESKFPSLILRRPPNHTSIENRYKKQGLTRTRSGPRPRQRRSDGMERGSSESDSPRQGTDREPSPTATVFVQEIICSCREPLDGDGLDVVKCAGEHCMIGIYHMRCLGLEQLPTDEADWFCPQCVYYADRQRREKQVEADDTSNNDSNTLIATSSSIEDQGNDPSGESSQNEQDTWHAQEQAIVKGTIKEISEAINHPRHHHDQALEDDDGELDDNQEKGKAEESSSPVQIHGFRAINAPPSPTITPPSPEFDGNGSGHFTRSSKPLVARYYRTLLAREHANMAVINRNHPLLVSIPQATNIAPATAATTVAFATTPALSPISTTSPVTFPASAACLVSSPATSSRTPFYALAPFITPSHADEDPHALTLEESRRFWGWRAHCSASAITTELVQAIPHATRDFLAQEDRNAMTGLGEWWREEMTAIKGEYHLMVLSEVLGTSPSAQIEIGTKSLL
ncbi:hypothetical protein DV736_g5413, partial [Chaetothyriales sp. CBS 134916]